jgi:hypothetical protein
MRKLITALTVIQASALLATGSMARAAAVEVPSLSNGQLVKCTASQSGTKATELDFEVFYRLDPGQKEANAYFRKVINIGDYGYDGTCGTNVCGLQIRDLRTNTVSYMNANYSPLNENSAQIAVTNFVDDVTATLRCRLVK